MNITVISIPELMLRGDRRLRIEFRFTAVDLILCLMYSQKPEPYSPMNRLPELSVDSVLLKQQLQMTRCWMNLQKKSAWTHLISGLKTHCGKVTELPQISCWKIVSDSWNVWNLSKAVGIAGVKRPRFSIKKTQSSNVVLVAEVPGMVAEILHFPIHRRYV